MQLYRCGVRCPCRYCNSQKRSSLTMACPKGSGSSVKLSEVVGSYETTKMKCCKVDVCEIAPDCGCVCFKMGPVPYSGTVVCKAGDNVWANFEVQRLPIDASKALSLLSLALTLSRLLNHALSPCVTRATALSRRKTGSTAIAWAARTILPRSAAALPRRRRWSARSSSGWVPAAFAVCAEPGRLA